VRAALRVANDGPPLEAVSIDVGGVGVDVGRLPAHRASALGDVSFAAPAGPGPFEVVVRLADGGTVVAENRYELRAVAASPAEVDVQVLGGGTTADALRIVGATVVGDGPAVVAEAALDGAARDELAARVAAEETAAHVVATRRDAVARLRSVAGAAGLDSSGEPETLVAALDGWRATRTARGAVALAERPRPRFVTTDPTTNGNGAAPELATLLDGGPPDDLRGREEALRAERDERLAQAWAADLAACEARQRRDELAKAAAVDPVRAGDRSVVTALIEVAQAEVRRARAALEQQPAALPLPVEGPGVARADEEVELWNAGPV